MKPASIAQSFNSSFSSCLSSFNNELSYFSGTTY